MIFKISNWLDSVLGNGIPQEVVALCFNIYQDNNNNWSLELVGTDAFDMKDTDWACEEVTDFNTRNNPFTWKQAAKWNVVLKQVSKSLKNYLKNGKYAELLKSKNGIAVGFVDGDIEMLYIKRTKKQMSKNSVLILINVISILLLLAFYLVDVFVFKTPPTKNLFRVILIACGLTLSFNRLATKQKAGTASIEKAYAEQIGNAFEKDIKSKNILLSALSDYNKDNISNCLKKLADLQDKTATQQDRQVVNLFKALCLEEIGKKADAINVYNNILNENPTHATSLSNLSILYNEMGDVEKAIAAAQKAIECNNQNPYAYNNLASIYFKIYNLEKAEENALKALEIKKDFRQAASLLAIIYSVQNDTFKAEKYISIAVAAGQKTEELETAISNYKKVYLHKSELNSKIEEWKKLTGIPSIHFTLDGNSGKSVIGGKINEPAPLSSKGEHMRLLAAIFCSELPENDFLPKQGVLRFYITPDDHYGANFDNFDELNQQKGFRVLFDKDENKFKTSDYEGADDMFPINGSFRPSFTLETDAMTFCDFRFYNTLDKAAKQYTEGKFNAEDFEDDDFIDSISIENHKLGGFPCFVQEDPRDYDNNYAQYDTLLFQLVSDYNSQNERIMFGDAGICNFFIPSENLKNCDFSDILYTWDCG